MFTRDSRTFLSRVTIGMRAYKLFGLSLSFGSDGRLAREGRGGERRQANVSLVLTGVEMEFTAKVCLIPRDS